MDKHSSLYYHRVKAHLHYDFKVVRLEKKIAFFKNNCLERFLPQRKHRSSGTGEQTLYLILHQVKAHLHYCFKLVHLESKKNCFFQKQLLRAIFATAQTPLKWRRRTNALAYSTAE